MTTKLFSVPTTYLSPWSPRFKKEHTRPARPLCRTASSYPKGRVQIPLHVRLVLAKWVGQTCVCVVWAQVLRGLGVSPCTSDPTVTTHMVQPVGPPWMWNMRRQPGLQVQLNKPRLAELPVESGLDELTLTEDEKEMFTALSHWIVEWLLPPPWLTHTHPLKSKAAAS